MRHRAFGFASKLRTNKGNKYEKVPKHSIATTISCMALV